MNPLTQFKKIRILPLLIAPALIIIAVLTPVPAGATPSCLQLESALSAISRSSAV